MPQRVSFSQNSDLSSVELNILADLSRLIVTAASNHLGPSEPLILRVVHRKMGKLEMRGVRLRGFIWHPMTVGRCKVAQNDRNSKLRPFLVLLVPKVSVTKVVRQA